MTKNKSFISLKENSFFQMLINFYNSKIKKFTPKITFKLEKGNYIIKTAENYKELQQSLYLRYKVFYEELLDSKKDNTIDIDQFDFISDHLLVIDKRTNQCIGSYRMISSTYSKEFYSQTEFDIDNILKIEGNKLELGRACINTENRNGLTIALLWIGITEYIKHSKANYLFGCSSVKTTDFFQIGSVFKYLKDHYYSDDSLRVYPKKEFQTLKTAFDYRHLTTYTDFLNKLDHSYHPKIATKLVPSLLKSYLKAGALICGEPALDKEFQCVDFFTLLNVEDLTSKVTRKFNI